MNETMQRIFTQKIQKHGFFLAVAEFERNPSIAEWEGDINFNEDELCFDQNQFEIRLTFDLDTIENIICDIPFIITAN